MTYALLITAFVISTCGLVYELIAGTIASYLLGDSITQFSTVIGVYLFSMGIGSFLSRYIEKNVALTFVQVELLIGLIGGSSASILFLLFEHVDNFRILLYSLVSIIGILIGLEIPLLMRILKERLDFKELVSQVFTFDYIGALLASLLFPLILVPYLGLIRTSFLFGLFNLGVAIWTIRIFRDQLPWKMSLQTTAFLLVIALVAGFAFSDKLTGIAEASAYPDPVIYSTNTPYQRIVITGNTKDLRLFLNGNLQFSSRDEYRYHEALVHPAMASMNNPQDILVLGGGDGLAVRELLKYPSVRSITLVDLDKRMIDLFKEQELLTRLNGGSLNNPKVNVIINDAFVWLRTTKQKFDLAIVDFPDPSNYSLGKLYSDTFYKALKGALKPDGMVVVQSTSPYYAKNSFWCVDKTLASVGFHTTPYHAYVPSFGDWGYVIASLEPFKPAEEKRYPAGLRYVSDATVAQMLCFARDMLPTVSSVNRLNNQSLVHLFESEWSEYVDAH
ncbi:MAG: polyamine aminopropyltransferase [Candidatus Obscuribacterales bacterium]|nr:polyamine aminopropyltransferase [Cyanobacteria bacterium SZAS LIN-5]RTL39815.1 MAG: polyamine aminopropyltransferase [Candidatus Melainabacteria bacterium]